MWEVYEHRRMDRRVQRLPVDILKRYEKWKDIVRISGPAGLRLIKGLHDGYRSSRLGFQYRVIYKVLGRDIRVEVIDITAHDYRRK